ncbi:acyltransferase family protein [Oceanobacter sp. 5_MG-2023]|uniref:acyltransferase family protein n=1 Tax=Oceanobacter sp. 5_MG-2023 TaxID=3062645 RepID=UPI0026E1F6D8|nr:acyltransferase family protein [Oceanobacter sp. 5_MG-2023]MDO6681336.1 acyltransferase family protein [Oceanobacter sp. 5_MG-2023]
MKRDLGIDIMRVIGLLCIVLAHVSPPYFVFQLRNFDVPLMVFVSGVSYFLSGGMSGSYLKYFIKRLKRLVVPVWIFFAFYFMFFIVVLEQSFTFRQLFGTLFLTGGIGYVWIIRVFLLMAILAPVVIYISKRFEINLPFIGLFLISLVQVLFFCFDGYLLDGLGKIFSVLILYTLGYLGVFVLGYWVAAVGSKKLIYAFLCSFLVFSFSFFVNYEGGWVNTQSYKYPPQLMYLSYAMCVSFVLYIVRSYMSHFLIFLKMEMFVGFVSGNSIWIYLWHIAFLSVYALSEYEWGVRYFGVLISSIILVYIQVSIVDFLEAKVPSWKKYLRYLKG